MEQRGEEGLLRMVGSGVRPASAHCTPFAPAHPNPCSRYEGGTREESWKSLVVVRMIFLAEQSPADFP